MPYVAAGLAAVNAYQQARKLRRVTEHTFPEDRRDSYVDSIASILHLARADGADLDSVIRSARLHVNAEGPQSPPFGAQPDRHAFELRHESGRVVAWWPADIAGAAVAYDAAEAEGNRLRALTGDAYSVAELYAPTDDDA